MEKDLQIKYSKALQEVQRERNALRAENEQLKQLLTEKDEEIVKLGYCVDFYKSYSDSFKEKVADELIKIKYEVLKEIKNMNDKYIFADCIDNQIKQLTHQHEDKGE